NDFTFWALSSWGDSSRLGGASGKLDSRPPAISGEVTGTVGDGGWYVSEVTVTGSAGDAVSGVVSFDLALDGGEWAPYDGPLTLPDGEHTVELRAGDAAGNQAVQSLEVRVDTQPPDLNLAAGGSFCPGCGEALDIALDVQDEGSGVAEWSLTADGRPITSGSGPAGETCAWDGAGLQAGTHMLTLSASDVAGNTASASISVTLILPTPTPTDVPTATPEPPSIFSLFSAPTATATPPPGASPTPVRSPTATRTPLVISFGGGGPPPAPLGPSSDDGSSGPISNLGSLSSSPSLLSSPGVYYGGAALALGAAATAAALDQARKRKEEEARQREEMRRLNAEAEAREEAERARLAALYAAAAAGAEAMRREAARRGQDQDGRLIGLEDQLDPEFRPAPQLSPTRPQASSAPPPPFDLAKWKQQDYAEVARAQEQEETLRRQQAYRSFRDQEWASTATLIPLSARGGASLPQVQGRWPARGIRWLRNLRNVRRSSALAFHDLESGYTSIRVAERIPAGEKIPFRISLGFPGTRYLPETVRRITTSGLIRSIFSKGNLGVGLITSVLSNVYDYTLGEHRGESFGREFWVSTGVDFVMTVGTGLAAAGVVALGVLVVGGTPPLWGAIAATAIVGAGITWILDRIGAGDWLKENVSEGLGAWSGVWDNAGTIARALPGYVTETVVRPAVAGVRERVVQPIGETAQAVAEAVRGAATSVGEAVSGFIGRLFGGGG
ncbi:MAG: OmpL47-type beta-barrel domain-containing protein, partial [Candidatus Oleimicrobiaceae bacterium]